VAATKAHELRNVPIVEEQSICRRVVAGFWQGVVAGMERLIS
jgi:hypothetical protein